MGQYLSHIIQTGSLPSPSKSLDKRLNVLCSCSLGRTFWSTNLCMWRPVKIKVCNEEEHCTKGSCDWQCVWLTHCVTLSLSGSVSRKHY
jgi:hypothetical protein